jgi:N-acetylneuraminate lyase
MEERKHILEVVSQEAKGKATIIAHIGCIATGHAIELGSHAADLGVDAISSIPPFYYKFSLPEIKSYYLDIVEAVNAPMILYNFPALTGVALTNDNVGDLLAHERIIGVKHTSFDLHQLQRMLELNPGLTVFNGHDEIFLAGLSMGARSAIGSTYNFMAEKFIAILKYFGNGQMEEALRLQAEANAIIDVLIRVGVFQGIRAALEMMGLPCGGCRKPFKKLTEDEKSMLRKVLQ